MDSENKTPSTGSGNRLASLGINARVLGILGLLIFLWFFLSIYAGDRFYGLNNIENLMKRTGLYGILGIGVAFIIITSGIDLSIGSLVCLMACLLSIFLQVDYAPPKIAEVGEARAEQRQVLIPDKGEQFAAGDQIRFFGGNYAANLMATVESIAKATLEDGRSATAITLDRPLSRDDDRGFIVQTYGLVDVSTEGSADADDRQTVVTLEGDHSYFAARDRFDFFCVPDSEQGSSSGRKQYNNIVITNVSVASGNTKVTVDGHIAELTTGWTAVFKERRQAMSIPMALAWLFGIALALGLVHGLLVTRLSLPPFVVTLCGLLIYRGVSRSLMNDQVGGFGNEYEKFQQLGAGKLTIWASDGGATFGLPYPFLVLIVVGIAASIFLNRSIWGRYLLAIGRNEEAARYSGINTNRMIMLAYVIGVFASTIGGILFALYSNSIPPSSFGAWFELYAIAAAVLGGCSLRGGEGSIFGVIVGAALMQTLYNLIQMLDIPGFSADQIEQAVIGAVILIGVSVDEIVRRAVAARRAKPVEEATTEAAA